MKYNQFKYKENEKINKQENNNKITMTLLVIHSQCHSQVYTTVPVSTNTFVKYVFQFLLLLNFIFHPVILVFWYIPRDFRMKNDACV